MSTGTNINNSPISNNTFAQFNPSQFGLQGTANNGFFAGLGGIPLGGFGATNSGDGSFDSLFSSLNSSGTFGPGLYSNLGPAGSNPQAISVATEGAAMATTALLNKIAPIDMPVESQFSSSAYGTLMSGASLFDTLSVVANSFAGIIPLNGVARQVAQGAGPVIGAIGGIFGVLQGLRAAFNTPSPLPASSPEARDEYLEEA